MRKSKKFSGMALAPVLAATVLVGCSTPEAASGGANAESCAEKRAAKEGEPLKVGVAFAALNTNAVFIDAVKALKEKAAEDGNEIITADITEPEAGVKALENFVAADVDVIISQIFNEDLVAAQLPQIQEKCIVFGSYDAITEEAEYSILADNEELGRLIGEEGGKWMNEHFNGEGQAAITSYEPLEFLKVRSDGIEAAFLETCPKCEIVQTFKVAGFPEEGLEAGENLLQAHPDVKLVMGINDGGILGVYEAFKAAGKNDPDSNLALIGCDASVDGLNAIREGGIYRATISLDLVDQIVGLYERSVMTAHTGEIDEENRVVEYPMTPIYRDNIDEA